jgi:peptide/nickel transport system permease protein
MSTSNLITQEVVTGGQTAGVLEGPSEGYWKQSWTRLRRDRFGMTFAVILAVLGALSLAAPAISALVTHYDPNSQDLTDIFGRASTAHWLGTDELGRDTLTRLVWGGRISLGVALLSVTLFITIGTTVGMFAGYYRGIIDEILMRAVDMLLAIPPIFLFILVSSLLPIPIGLDPGHPWFIIRHNPISLAVVIASVSWGWVARLVRNEVLSLRDRDFVLAAHSLGASDWRLMFRHLLPNVLPVIIVAASLGVGQIVLVEAGLDFIGVGIQPPDASWGDMLTNAQREDFLYHSPLLVILPGAAILLSVLSANMLGNAMRDAFDPRSANR